MVQSVGLTPRLTTRDNGQVSGQKQLVSVPEDMSRALGSNPRPLDPRSVTLPRAG